MTAELAMPLAGTLVMSYALFLAWLFARAGVHKLTPGAGARYAEVLAGYALPKSAALARGIGSMELITALLLVAPTQRDLGALLAAGLLFSYSAGIAWQLWQGRTGADCGCAGPAGRLVIGPELLVRNLILLLLVVCFGLGAGVSTVTWALALPAALVLIFLHLAVEQLLANAPQLRALRR